MGACMMTTGAVSGYVQKAVGYQWFFIIVLLAAVPSMLATMLAPFPHPDVTMREVKKAEAEPKADRRGLARGAAAAGAGPPSARRSLLDVVVDDLRHVEHADLAALPPKIGSSLSSALIMRRFLRSCRPSALT